MTRRADCVTRIVSMRRRRRRHPVYRRAAGRRFVAADNGAHNKTPANGQQASRTDERANEPKRLRFEPCMDTKIICPLRRSRMLVRLRLPSADRMDGRTGSVHPSEATLGQLCVCVGSRNGTERERT